MGKHLLITTCHCLYVARIRCFQPGSGTTTATEKLLKILPPNSFILPSAKLLKDTLFTTSRLRAARIWKISNYGSAANSMPSNMKNELLAILEVDFGQFCAGPSLERRYKVRSPIFRFSDRFYNSNMPLYHSLVALKLLPHRWHNFYCTLGI